MITEKIIISILNLPRRFYSKDNNRSIISLVEETGYFKYYNSINENTIKETLKKQPEYIDQWLGWSEDKRVDSGWYFKRNTDESYVVGFLDTENHRTLKTNYTDKYSACASFIKKEIENMRIDEQA